MSLAQTFVLGWLQFAIASAAILFAASFVARRLAQPVDRIRLVQVALATATALPIVGLFSPLALWRIPVASGDRAVAAVADCEITRSAAETPSTAPVGPTFPPALPVAGDERDDRETDLAAAKPQSAARAETAMPSTATVGGPPASEPALSVALPLDGWALAASILLAAHALAAIYFAVEAAIGFVRLRRIVREASAPDASIERIWHSVANEEGANVRLLVTSAVRSPATCGLFRPCILLPSDLAAFGDRAVRACLAHEWSHIASGDLREWRFAWACQFLFWMQPSFWRLRSELRLSQEMIADARSTEACEDAIEYSELLVRFARRRGSPSLGGALTFADRPSQLSRRIAMLLEPKASVRSRCSLRFSALSLLAALAAAVPFAAVRLDAAPIDEVAADEPPTVAEVGADEEPAAAAPTPPENEDATDPVAENPVAENNDAETASQDKVARDELAGTVVNEEGRPIEGVTVDAWHWYSGNETKTDAQGRFSIKGLDPDTRAEVLIKKEGYSPQHFAQRPLGVAGWVVTLSDKTYLEGKIVGADGKPAANADIRASFGPVQGDGVQISEVTTEGKSREDGTYRLYLQPGTYDFQVSDGAQGVYRSQGVPLKENEAKPYDVALKPGVRFEARVVDSLTGEPVEGFVLWQWRPPYLKAKSDAEGKIVFEGLIPGPIEFQCGGGEPKKLPQMSGSFYEHGPFGRWWSPDSPREWERKTVDDPQSGWQRNFDGLSFALSIGMPPVTVVVEQGVKVSGRVTDPDGKPVAGATVAPARTGSGNSLTGDTRYSVKTKEDGTYEVVLPASGKATYNLIVHDGEFQQWRTWANGVSEPMQTTPGQIVEDLDLQLTRPATVRGKATFGGKPAVGKQVRAHAADKRENRYYDPTTTTKEDGTFELKFVRPGKHYIQAEPFWLSAEDAPGGSTAVVDLEPDEVLEGVELTALPERTEVMPEIAKLPFTAKVVDADGKPVANVEVALGILGGVASQLGTLAEQPGASAKPNVTNENGIAKIDASMLGQFRMNAALVYAVDREGQRAAFTTLDLDQYLTLAPSATPDPIEMKLEPATAAKIVVDAKAFGKGSAQPDNLYLIVSWGGMQVQAGGLAKAGAWEILLPPGKYQVGCYATHWAENAEAEFELAAGEATQEETIELKPSRLAQLIGKPAPEFQQIKTSGGKTPLQLAELRGKVVLLDFWGNWCGPCIAAMPNLVELHNEFQGQGLEIVAIHDDSVESVEELDTIVADLVKNQWNGKALPFTVLLDGGGPTAIPGTETMTNGATTAAYGIAAFPTTIIVDREGKVAGILNAHDLKAAQAKLREMLNSPGS